MESEMDTALKGCLLFTDKLRLQRQSNTAAGVGCFSPLEKH